MIKFGAKVTISARYKRHYTVNTAAWMREYFTTKKVGIFLGYRTLQNGFIHRNDYDRFEVTERVKVALVCFTPNTNPIYVPLVDPEMEVI